MVHELFKILHSKGFDIDMTDNQITLIKPCGGKTSINHNGNLSRAVEWAAELALVL
jgi:hypothetical protein